MPRNAQAWAVAALERMKLVVGNGNQFPMDFPGAVMMQGEATRFTQEINFAIKQHNQREEEKKAKRWEEQMEQAKKSKNGSVTIPDYEMERIIWVVKFKLIDPPSIGETRQKTETTNQLPGYQPRVQLYADFPTGKQKKLGKMQALVNAFLKPLDLPKPAASDNIFEEWLKDFDGKNN